MTDETIIPAAEPIPEPDPETPISVDEHVAVDAVSPEEHPHILAHIEEEIVAFYHSVEGDIRKTIAWIASLWPTLKP